jgi:epoxide hydrolase 4
MGRESILNGAWRLKGAMMDLTPEGEALEHRTVQANGIELHVVLAGPADGVPVVLLHGFPEFWYGWRHQIGPLAQAGYRVIVPDLRGYNFSSKPRSPRHYLPELLQADVLGLMDQLQAPQAHVIGHDWGGLIGWWLAEAHPQRLRRLVILNAPHPGAFQRVFLRRPTQQLRSSYMLWLQPPLLPELVLRQGDFWLMAQSLVRTCRPGTFTEAELVHYREAWSQAGALTAMLAWYRAIPFYAARPASGVRVRVPTLILWGERDLALSRTLAAESLAKCDTGRLERLSQAGHWLHHEEAVAVNRRLVEFLGEEAVI